MKVHCSLSQLWRSFPKAALVYKVSGNLSHLCLLYLWNGSTMSLEREQRAWGNHRPFWWFGPEVAHTSLPLVNPNMVPTWLQEQLECSHRKGKGAWWAPNLISAMKYFCEGHRQYSIGGSVNKGNRVEQGEFSLFRGETMPLWWLEGRGMFMVLRLQHCVTPGQESFILQS